MSQSETELKREICQALDRMGIFWRRLNSGKVKCRGGGWMHLCPAGTADLLAAPERHGKAEFCWIETKKIGEEQTSEQIQFQSDVEARGMTYIVARSLDDVLKSLREA